MEGTDGSASPPDGGTDAATLDGAIPDGTTPDATSPDAGNVDAQLPCDAAACGAHAACPADGFGLCACNPGFNGDGTTCAPQSCLTLLRAAPTTPSGVYLLDPDGTETPVMVYCDMETDGGGWTLVSSSNVPVDDKAQAYAGELTSLSPAGMMDGVWGGMRPVMGAISDIRFTCQKQLGSDFAVDLSFYGTEMYDGITTGPRDVDSCTRAGERDDNVGIPYSRRDNVAKVYLPSTDRYEQTNPDKQVEFEDNCGDENDFTVDFDDSGMDENESDGTDWGSDDNDPKCAEEFAGVAWFIFVRESHCGDGTTNDDETDLDCGGAMCTACTHQQACELDTDCRAPLGEAACESDAKKCNAQCDNGVQDGDETDLDCGGPSCMACRDGAMCVVPPDCDIDSGPFACTDSKCVTPCGNDTKDADETDVDCGGDDCRGCAAGQACIDNDDCASTSQGGPGVCEATVCVQHCNNGVKDRDETDMDCGGSECDECEGGQACLIDDDCDSPNGPDVCLVGAMTCDASCANGVKDNDESDVDCGGPYCSDQCLDGQACLVDDDCEWNGTGRFCNPSGMACVVHCDNDVKDYDETDEDCGGAWCHPCEHGEACLVDDDCGADNGDDSSAVCSGLTCFSHCDSGIKDGDETGVDCGGAVCSDRCPLDEGCLLDTDCEAQIFPVACHPDDSTCRNPCIDGKQSLDETDIDCGGPLCKPCAVGAQCALDSDCASHDGPGVCNLAVNGGTCEGNATDYVMMVALDGVFQGDFGSTAAADALCVQAAGSSPHTWRALLSDDNQKIVSFNGTDDQRPVYNGNGDLLYPTYAKIFREDGHGDEADFDFHSFDGRRVADDEGFPGGRVWTGTIGGDDSDHNCANWTSTLDGYQGRTSQDLANRTQNRHHLFIAHRFSCNGERGIMCVAFVGDYQAPPPP